MMIPGNYIKKPIPIKAIQLTEENRLDVVDWCRGYCSLNGSDIYITTLEGDMKTNIDDYIIQGIKGEFYPCKADIFEDSYYCVDDTNDEKEN